MGRGVLLGGATSATWDCRKSHHLRTAAGYRPEIQNHGGTLFATWFRMLKWQRAEDLLAETAREVGVLILVFAPLEAAFAEQTVTGNFVTVMLVVGLGLIAGGIIVGARR